MVRRCCILSLARIWLAHNKWSLSYRCYSYALLYYVFLNLHCQGQDWKGFETCLTKVEIWIQHNNCARSTHRVSRNLRPVVILWEWSLTNIIKPSLNLCWGMLDLCLAGKCGHTFRLSLGASAEGEKDALSYPVDLLVPRTSQRPRWCQPPWEEPLNAGKNHNSKGRNS